MFDEVGEDLRHRELAVLAVEVVDGEAADLDRMGRVESRR